MSSNPWSRSGLASLSNLADSLEGVIRKSSLRSLHLSTLVCQVLYNMLLGKENSDGETPAQLFIPTIGDSLIDALEELVDCAKELENGEIGADGGEWEVGDLSKLSESAGNKEKKTKYSDFIRVGGAVLKIIKEF
jgi:hypothetical protein